MDRLVIVARLKGDAHARAQRLIEQGPPFEPEDLGFRRHAVYLTATDVVFVFEAPEVEWIVSDIIDDPVLSAAFGPWRAIIEEPPRLAHERFYWHAGSRAETKPSLALGL